MPRKSRHTKSTHIPPPEVRAFLAEVGEVVREYLEAKRRSGTIMADTNDEGAHDDESGRILPGE